METTKLLYPLVVVDIALFCVKDDRLKVLLVQRAEAPEQRRWALPGGFLRPEEDASLEHAARRVLRDKVSVDIPHVEEVQTFSGADRDPRGWSVSVLYGALLPSDQTQAVVRNKVEAVDWSDAEAPGHRLAFDHAAQIRCAMDRLRFKVEHDTLPLHLLPEKFTLTQLQRTCEAVLGRDLDKAAFRRKLKGHPDLVELDEYVRGAQRPAQLFRACKGFRFL